MPTSKSGRGPLVAGGVAALLASACCLGPLLLITLGVSGAWIGNLTAMEPYRPLFIGLAALTGYLDVVLFPSLAFFIGLTFYALWRKKQYDACCDHGSPHSRNTPS